MSASALRDRADVQGSGHFLRDGLAVRDHHLVLLAVRVQELHLRRQEGRDETVLDGKIRRAVNPAGKRASRSVQKSQIHDVSSFERNRPRLPGRPRPRDLERLADELLGRHVAREVVRTRQEGAQTVNRDLSRSPAQSCLCSHRTLGGTSQTSQPCAPAPELSGPGAPWRRRGSPPRPRRPTSRPSCTCERGANRVRNNAPARE